MESRYEKLFSYLANKFLKEEFYTVDELELFVSLTIACNDEPRKKLLLLFNLSMFYDIMKIYDNTDQNYNDEQVLNFISNLDKDITFSNLQILIDKILKVLFAIGKINYDFNYINDSIELLVKKAMKYISKTNEILECGKLEPFDDAMITSTNPPIYHSNVETKMSFCDFIEWSSQIFSSSKTISKIFKFPWKYEYFGRF